MYNVNIYVYELHYNEAHGRGYTVPGISVSGEDLKLLFPDFIQTLSFRALKSHFWSARYNHVQKMLDGSVCTLQKICQLARDTKF